MSDPSHHNASIDVETWNGEGNADIQMIDTNDDNEEVKVSKDGQIDKRGKNWLLEKTLEG